VVGKTRKDKKISLNTKLKLYEIRIGARGLLKQTNVKIVYRPTPVGRLLANDGRQERRRKKKRG